MGRKRRPYLPGGIFHLTARTLRREHLFTPRLRSAALRELARVVPRSRARLLAVAIMPNHLHLVIQQGDRPLSSLMQPLLRRLALRIQAAHGIEGPVFWRGYGSQACLDPSYARNAIVYTHLNPIRAGLCEDALQYPWTSHALYEAGSRAGVPVELAPIVPVLQRSSGLALFATQHDRASSARPWDYRRFVEYRLAVDRAAAGEDPRPGDADRLRFPPALWGAGAWSAAMSPLFHSPVQRGEPGRGTGAARAGLDLSEIARRTLAAEAPGMSIDHIRGRRGGREHARLRHVVIRRLHAAGFRNTEISRFIDLSESAVSSVICASG